MYRNFVAKIKKHSDITSAVLFWFFLFVCFLTVVYVFDLNKHVLTSTKHVKTMSI